METFCIVLYLNGIMVSMTPMANFNNKKKMFNRPGVAGAVV